jgi:hypothetical protein
MVDFPEGYGFEPNGKAKLMQESFAVDIGTFIRKVNEWDVKSRRRSPYRFAAIGFIRKENNDTPIRGILFGDLPGGRPSDAPPPIEGTLQQVVAAMCTLHRMRGHMK